MKKLIVICCVLIVSIGLTNIGNSSVAAKEAVQQNEKIVLPREKGTSAAVKKMNAKITAVEKQLQQTKTEFLKEEQIEKAAYESEEENAEFGPWRTWEFLAQTNVTRTTKNVSYLVSVYTYTGGAHGSTVQYSYNFDAKTGKELKLSDVIGTKNNAKIKEQVFNTFLKKFGKDGLLISSAKEIVLRDDKRVWTFGKKNNVILHFGQYEVGPYAIGIVPISIEIPKK
ncbi:MAG: PdaC/SigV domain-containing protein [Bacilli bacterium]